MAKFVKYFLLTAKIKNGNSWGISPETAEHNMKYFVNRPLICTDRSWFPNSAYDSYDHAYLPSNDLYAVLRHQEPYRVGTIREIQKTGDNYYAIAEILPKFASKSFPPFCSPAIFQVNPMEDEGHINQWIPLHLAILDTSPAYGAQIALLKGTCSGTPEACSIQLKTAKLLKDESNVCFGCKKSFKNFDDLMKHELSHEEKISKLICPEKVASKIRDLRKESGIEEEPDNDADLERFMEQKDERFKQNIDRHVNRGGKQLSADEQPSVKINPEHGKQIADAYGSMKHDPNNPDVKKSYDALINETGKQYSDLIKGGLKIDKIKPGETPYKNSQDMHKDLSENNHLHYFPTEHGFGAGEENKDHPMMRETEFKHEDKPMLANDVFRIVHDINGHHKGGMSGFGPKGEHQAYLTHKKMYSPEAQGALASETMGQNNYVNFGPNGEHNRKDPGHTIYAPQKAGLMPDKIVNGNFHSEDKKIAILQAKLQKLAFERPFKKSLMHENGDLEEVNMYGQRDYGGGPDKKLSGYGVGYSHPQHLRREYGERNIKSFKDMDKALDKHKLMRVMDDEKGRTINIGNKATPQQLDTIKKQFETHDKPVRAGITSISRKYHKTFNDFQEAYKNHSGMSGEDVGNQAFKTHTQSLSSKLARILKADAINPNPVYQRVIFRLELNHKKHDICDQYEDEEFNMDDPDLPQLPLHPNCRCYLEDVYTGQIVEGAGSGGRVEAINIKYSKLLISSYHKKFFLHESGEDVGNQAFKTHTQSLSSKLQKLAIVKSPDKFKVTDELKHTRADSNGPLINKVPFGEEDRDTSEQFLDRKIRGINYERTKDNQIKPDKPKQRDRTRIIQAKLQKLGSGDADLKGKQYYHESYGMIDGVRRKVISSGGMYKIKKIRPPKPTQRDMTKIISAKLQKLGAYSEMTPSLNHQDNKEEPTFHEAQRLFNNAKYEGRIDHSKGFTYVPKDNKVYDANNKEDALALQKRFGNGKDAIHAIARTDNHSDKLDENHKFNGKTMREHYDDIVKEGKTPTIGGFDEGGDKTTDIATVEPLSDEKAREKIKEHGQRSSGKIGLDGKFEIFS